MHLTNNWNWLKFLVKTWARTWYLPVFHQFNKALDITKGVLLRWMTEIYLEKTIWVYDQFNWRKWFAYYPIVKPYIQFLFKLHCRAMIESTSIKFFFFEWYCLLNNYLYVPSYNAHALFMCSKFRCLNVLFCFFLSIPFNLIRMVWKHIESKVPRNLISNNKLELY